jgi:copper(I)-binding protein
MKWLRVVLPLLCTLTLPAFAESPAPLRLSAAWVHAGTQTGADAALMMTVTNTSDTPDSLIRARCEAATFTELRVVDTGEGAPAPRVVKSISIGAKASVKLSDQTAYIALLQTTQPLPKDASFDCKITFRQAGTLDAHVVASDTPPAS